MLYVEIDGRKWNLSEVFLVWQIVTSIQFHVKEGWKIPCVKIVRATTRTYGDPIGLKQAKDIVEWVNEWRELIQQLYNARVF